MKAERRINRILPIVFGVLALFFLIPVFILFLTSIRSDEDFFTRGVFSLPLALRWENFADAWRIGNFNNTYTNSFLITLVKVPLGLLISALAAYPLAKMKFPFDGALFIFFIAGLAVPIHVALLPLFILERNLGLLGNLWALLLPYIAFGIPFQVFVLRGFMRLIPSEIIEAARVDGASNFYIFVRIMIPLIAPALATLAIIDAVATWNEFIMALILLPDNNNRTLPLGMLNFFNQFAGSHTKLSAGLVLGILPLLTVYIFLQRYLVSGLARGAVKG